jgi:hypothetical protein
VDAIMAGSGNNDLEEALKPQSAQKKYDYAAT